MTKEFGDILYKILSKEGVPDFHTKIIKQMGYQILKKHFKYFEKEYDKFFTGIEKDPNKLEKFDDVIRFYYFWCKKPSLDSQLPPDFKLIVMFSIIESLMTSSKYMTFSDWLKHKISKEKLVIDSPEKVGGLLEEYHSIDGSRKKVMVFFETHYPPDEVDKLLKSIRSFNDSEKKFEPLSDINELLFFVEGIRNLFIHKATNIQIDSSKKYEEDSEGYTHYRSETLTAVNGKSYSIDNEKMHMEALLDSFEKSLINYFG